ncbi:hypothetical protein [Streptomyces hoynatensis]|uniref:Uncharacterized protein n=1 Tax=Streptomyces hoynatensis TaxID=1141874 RepID=A0A3A9YXY6_9ACTN|nr:hypothetical protein [Streptomyces hoynatensis]RKN40740.1 hypothetical protein D7294_16740 [Streptomyces hoynatensis]
MYHELALAKQRMDDLLAQAERERVANRVLKSGKASRKGSHEDSHEDPGNTPGTSRKRGGSRGIGRRGRPDVEYTEAARVAGPAAPRGRRLRWGTGA